MHVFKTTSYQYFLYEHGVAECIVKFGLSRHYGGQIDGFGIAKNFNNRIITSLSCATVLSSM